MADARPYAGAVSIDWQPLIDAIEERLGERFDERFDRLEGKLDSLDDYVRNHLTSLVNQRSDALDKAVNAFQEHAQHGKH